MTASTVATRTRASKMQLKQARSCVMSITDGGLRSNDIEARRHDLDFLHDGQMMARDVRIHISTMLPFFPSFAPYGDLLVLFTCAFASTIAIFAKCGPINFFLEVVCPAC